MEMPFDWRREFFDPAKGYLARLEEIALEFFNDATVAQIEASNLLDILSKNNWKKLSGYRGESQPHIFLETVVKRALIDGDRNKYGRIRAPAWLKRLGGIWIEIYKLLCIKRVEIPIIISALSMKGADESQLNEYIRIIKKEIPRCGEFTREVTMPLESDIGGELSVDSKSPIDTIPGGDDLETELNKTFHEAILTLLGCLFDNDADSEAVMVALEAQQDRNVKRLAEAVRAIEMTDADRVLLRLHYKEGLKIAAIARLLNTPEHTIRRNFTKVNDRLMSCFSVAGIKSYVMSD